MVNVAAHAGILAFLAEVSMFKMFLLLLSSLLLYSCALVVYRLYFHPLKEVPRPWYAAATGWYEFYHDVIVGGNFSKTYPALHAKYGPVVRVTPHRVQIDDPNYFRDIYGQGTRYLKDPSFYQQLGGIKHSILMLIDPKAHKERHNKIKELFSLKAVHQLAPSILKTVAAGLDVAKVAHARGLPLDIQQLFATITVDTIMIMMFNKNLRFVDSEDEKPPFLDSMNMFSRSALMTKHFPFITTAALNLPRSLAQMLLPGYVQFRDHCGNWIEEVRQRHERGIYAAEDGRSSLFDLLIDETDEKNSATLSNDALIDEAFALCFAGTDTSTLSMSIATYYVLSCPSKLALLRAELLNVQSTPEGLLEYKDIVGLPYLTAVIKESLRLSSPVPGILPRLVPAGGLHIHGLFLPEGTAVSQALRAIHQNADLFPQPGEFLPERWLGEQGKSSEKWLVAFGKGPRGCLGINIAYMEIYLCLANFFRAFDMQLYETDEQSTQWTDTISTKLLKHVQVEILALRKPSKE